MRNRDRSETTRRALLDAARPLFLAHGHSGVAADQIVSAAGLTRGALYHHFDGKDGLFIELVEQEQARIQAAIEAATAHLTDPVESLAKGADAYFEHMSEPGLARTLLIDARQVMGFAAHDALDQRTAQASLSAGLEQVFGKQQLPAATLIALTAQVSAAFDRAALDIASGRDAGSVRRAMRLFLFAVAQIDAKSAS